MSPSTSTHGNVPVPSFESLGVRPIINCRGTYTVLTGSRALDVVVDAMVEATNHYVIMDELMDRVGARLSELTGAEWGYVSSGCAAALAEVAAACIAGADPEKMHRLPDTTGMRNEIVIQAGHRNSYDRAMRLAGARMVEVTTRAELEAAICERTALVAVTGDQAHLGEIPTQVVIDVAKANGVPCFVDAAAERPDVPNVYLEMGADAVAYSGGKCLRGPQSAGLVLGRRDLLWAAYLNGAPHHGVARPMKAGKEEIMGLLAAVEAWILGRDHEAEWRMWESYLETIRLAVAGLPSVRTETEQPGIANVAPCLRISWDPQVLGRTPAAVHQDLVDGEPCIALHLLDDGLRVNPYMMEDGDDSVVARRLRQVMMLRGREATGSRAPSVDVSGDWLIGIAYILGTSQYAVRLEQQEGQLSGSCRSLYASQPIDGTIEGRFIRLRTTLGYESSRTTYVFCGQVSDDDTMTGDLDCGEFGKAKWSAHRAD